MRIVEMMGKHIDLTPAIKQHVEDKLANVARLCEKFEPCDLRAEVGKTGAHHKSGDIFVAEFNLTIPGVMLRAESKADDLYKAIDQGTEELKRQVKRYKEKLQDADRVVMDTTVEEHEWSNDEQE